jgi:tellurite resistance protein
MGNLTSYTSKPGRLQVDYLPVGLIGSIMGLVELSVAWREASYLYGEPGVIADVIGAIAVTVCVALVLGYGWKCRSAWEVAKAEYQHPIAGSLFVRC